MKKLITYTDGGSRGNPGPAAIGVVVMDEQGNTILEYKRKIGENTNNVAEYMAMIKALNVCIDKEAKEVVAYSDSQLLVRQLNGEYKVKNARLKELHEMITSKLKQFDKITFRHVLRSNPGVTRADALVNEALDS